MYSYIDKKISRTQYLQTSASTLKLNVRARTLELGLQLGGLLVNPRSEALALEHKPAQP